MHEKKRIFYMYLRYVSIIIQHFETQHSDDLGDRKWLRTDFGVVWYTSIYLVFTFAVRTTYYALLRTTIATFYCSSEQSRKDIV